MDELQLFIGYWVLETTDPKQPLALTTFAWEMNGRYLVQRSRIPLPKAPDSMAIVSPVQRGPEQYIQHYFDDRGVVRTYDMWYQDPTWTLIRNKPDFSELDVQQKFTGVFGNDFNTIQGRWETSQDGLSWALDYEVFFRRTTNPFG